MLIGVSGSHCSGKSTLIDAFCERHPEFTRLPEPYEELDETWSEPSIEVFLDQFHFQVDQLQALDYVHSIVERTPLDSLAYLRALSETGRTFLKLRSISETALRVIQRFDLIVFVPTDEASIYVPYEEDRELRNMVNQQLRELFSDLKSPSWVEVSGSTSARLELIGTSVSQATNP